MKVTKSMLVKMVGIVACISFLIGAGMFVVIGLSKFTPESLIILENTTGTKNWEAKTEKYILNSYTTSTEGKVVLDVKDEGEMTFSSSEVNVITSTPPLKQMTVSVQYYTFIPVVQNGKPPLRGGGIDEVKIKGEEEELPKQIMTWGEIVNDEKIGNPEYGKSHSKIYNSIFKSEVPNLTKSIPEDIASEISKKEQSKSGGRENIVVRPFVTINK